MAVGFVDEKKKEKGKRMNIRTGWFGRIGILVGMLFMLAGCGKGDTAYSEGMKLAEEGKYEKALSQFQEAVKEDHKVAKYQIGYGMTYNHMGKYEEAEKVFSSAMEKLKDSASREEKKQFYYGEAVALSGQGEYEKAVKYCDKALKIDFLSDMDGDIGYTKTVCLARQGKLKEAEKLCKKIVQDNKKDWQAYYELADIQKQLGKPREAAKTYLILVEAEKGDSSAYFALYQIYLSMGETKKAEDILNQVLDWNTKKAANALAVGRAYYYKNDMDSASKYLKLAYDGNCKESLYYLGVISMNQKNYPEAEKHFLEYIKENEDDLNIEVYNQLAVAMMEQGEYKKAQDYLTRGKEFGMTEADQSLRKNQVVLYEKQKKYKKALAEAQEYVTRYPQDADMEKELAFIQTRIK